jgi:hypothetical protein
MAGLEQAFRHGQAHAAGSDPADLLSILRHPETLPLNPDDLKLRVPGL